MASSSSSENIIGFYSINSERRYDESASCLQYFKMPTILPVDLNIGIETRIKRSYFKREKIDSILKHIVLNKSDYMNGEHDSLIPCTQFITFRGVLRKLLRTAYDHRENWCIVVTKYRNNFYMGLIETDNDRIMSEAESNTHSKFTHYGDKFKQLCFSNDPSLQSDFFQQPDLHSQFFCVFKKKMANRDFVFGGDMGGILSDKKINLKKENVNDLTFVGVLTTSTGSFKSNKFERFKALNIWTQVFLSGIQHVYAGLRSEEGQVERIESFDIEKLVHLGRNYWSPAGCLKFFDHFLNLVEDQMKDIDCPHTIFQFEFDYITHNLTCTEHHGQNEMSLLPDWYLEAFEP